MTLSLCNRKWSVACTSHAASAKAQGTQHQQKHKLRSISRCTRYEEFLPFSITASADARLSTKSSTASVWPCLQATSRGVPPAAVARSTRARFMIRNLMISMCPCSQAMKSGVAPVAFGRSSEAPAAIKSLTISSNPFWHAMNLPT